MERDFSVALRADVDCCFNRFNHCLPVGCCFNAQRLAVSQHTWCGCGDRDRVSKAAPLTLGAKTKQARQAVCVCQFCMHRLPTSTSVRGWTTDRKRRTGRRLCSQGVWEGGISLQFFRGGGRGRTEGECGRAAHKSGHTNVSAALRQQQSHEQQGFADVYTCTEEQCGVNCALHLTNPPAPLPVCCCVLGGVPALYVCPGSSTGAGSAAGEEEAPKRVRVKREKRGFGGN